MPENLKRSIKASIRALLPHRLACALSETKRRFWLSLFFIGRIRDCKVRYARQLRRIRDKARRGEKIRVLFIVSEIAKWKEQKLYELMVQSEDFEPLVGLSAWNTQGERYCPNEALEKVLARAEEFFDRMGDRHVRTVRVENGTRVVSDLGEFDPDIVYYTEPWAPCGEQDPEHVSRFALTCYTPYFVPNYGIDVKEECHLPVHVFVWRYFCLGAYWCRFFRASYGWLDHVVRFVAVGHPALDFFSSQRDRKPKGNCVIYAPHCSVPHPRYDYFPQYFGTFDWNGQQILDYARRHPEIQWVFKPHPLLRNTLTGKNTNGDGLMTEREIDDYYAEWAKVGTVCTDGDYQDLFLDSRLMITDCGSFLMEYGATGRPVIHLICSKNVLDAAPPSKKIFDSYYEVHDLDEMSAVFKTVIEDGLDPKRDERLAAVRKAGIAGVNASENIMAHLRKELCRR